MGLTRKNVLSLLDERTKNMVKGLHWEQKHHLDGKNSPTKVSGFYQENLPAI